MFSLGLFKFSCFFLLGGAPPGGKLWKCLPRVLTVIFNRQMCFENIIFTQSTPWAIFPQLTFQKSLYFFLISTTIFRMCSLVLNAAEKQLENLPQPLRSRRPGKGTGHWVVEGDPSVPPFSSSLLASISSLPSFSFPLSLSLPFSFLLVSTKLLEGLNGWDNSLPWGYLLVLRLRYDLCQKKVSAIEPGGN